MPNTVTLPTPLRSYSQQERVVAAAGDTLGALLHDLDRQYPASASGS